MSSTTTISDWVKGIALSLAASIIGGASKLAIRKSWIMENEQYVWGEDEKEFSSSCLEENNTVQEGAVVYREGDEVTTQRHRSQLLLRLSGMFGMSVLNPLCCVLAMQYASPSILAPFSGLTLVWIVALAPMVLSEAPTRLQILSATLIVLGEVMVAVWGDHTNTDHASVQDVVLSYRQRPFLVFVVGFVIYFGLLLYGMGSSDCPVVQRFAWGASGGSITGVCVHSLAKKQKAHHFSKGFQNFLKDALTIVKVSQGDSDQAVPLALLILMVVGAAATAFSGLLLLTACMKRYDATYSSAMFVGSFVVCASIMSAVHYDTFDHLSHTNCVLYVTGLAVLVAGVGALIVDNDQSCVRYSKPRDCPQHQLQRLGTETSVC